LKFYKAKKKIDDLQLRLERSKNSQVQMTENASQLPDWNVATNIIADYFVQIQQLVQRNTSAEEQIRNRQLIWETRLGNIAGQIVSLERRYDKQELRNRHPFKQISVKLLLLVFLFVVWPLVASGAWVFVRKNLISKLHTLYRILAGLKFS